MRGTLTTNKSTDRKEVALRDDYRHNLHGPKKSVNFALNYDGKVGFDGNDIPSTKFSYRLAAGPKGQTSWSAWTFKIAMLVTKCPDIKVPH